MGDDVVAANGRQVRLARIAILKLKHPLGRIVVCCVFVVFVYGSVFCSLIQYISGNITGILLFSSHTVVKFF